MHFSLLVGMGQASEMQTLESRIHLDFADPFIMTIVS